MATERDIKILRFIDRYQDDVDPLDADCHICGAPVGIYCDQKHRGFHVVRGIAALGYTPPTEKGETVYE